VTATLGVALLAPGRVRAEAEAVRVRYSAPAGCSSRAAFVRELTLRTPRIRVVEESEPSTLFLVELADRSTGVAGELRWIERDGAETARAVSGATCEEVVSALALIAAVLVDPESSSQHPTSPPPVPPPASARPRERSKRRLRPSIAAGASVEHAVAPGWALGPELELALEGESDARRGPLAGLSVTRLTAPTASTPAGDADFTATLARLTLCPLTWPDQGSWFGRACAALEAGSLHAAGSRTLARREVSILWLAADPVLSLSYRPLRVLGIEADLLGIFPLVDDSFLFAPNLRVFAIPVAGFGARVRLRALWP